MNNLIILNKVSKFFLTSKKITLLKNSKVVSDNQRIEGDLIEIIYNQDEMESIKILENNYKN